MLRLLACKKGFARSGKAFLLSFLYTKVRIHTFGEATVFSGFCCVFLHEVRIVFFESFVKFHRFRAHLSHTKLCSPSVSVNRQQISAGKQHVKAVKVFSKTSIHYLDIAEIPLDNQERIVHFAAGCRLTMFDLFFPVYSVPRSFLWKGLPSAARRGWLALLLKWRFLRTTISHFASKKTPTRGVFCI